MADQADPRPPRWTQYMRLDNLVEAPDNPKTHALRDIERSLAEFGSIDPIVLDERTGHLISGHGRSKSYRALHAAGRPMPEGLLEDPTDRMWLVPVERGWRSKTDEHATAARITLNHLTTKGGWDERDLAEQLGDLQQVDMLTLTGFNDQDLDNLVALMRDTGWDDGTPGQRGGSRGGGLGEPAELDPTHDVADEDMWPRIDLRVPPEVFDAWRALLAGYQGKTDAARVADMLRDRGHLAETGTR